MIVVLPIILSLLFLASLVKLAQLPMPKRAPPKAAPPKEVEKTIEPSEAPKNYNVFSGNLHCTIKSHDKESVISLFLLTAMNSDTASISEQIALYEVGTPIEDANQYFSTREIARRHLLHNKDIYEYINENQIQIDDDWFNILRANASCYKEADKNGITGGDFNFTEEDESE